MLSQCLVGVGLDVVAGGLEIGHAVGQSCFTLAGAFRVQLNEETLEREVAPAGIVSFGTTVN